MARLAFPLRRAALAAGIGLLTTLIAAPFAHMYVIPKLIVTTDIRQTVANITAHESLFLAGAFALLITFVADLLITWALYELLLPVNRALSGLTALFRGVYSVVAIAGLLKLFSVFRLLNTPDYVAIVGEEQMYGQLYLLLRMFRYEWYVAFAFFSTHLMLLGWLVWRAGYIPRVLGALLFVNGVGYMLDWLRPYLYPETSINWIMILFFGEVIFMVWLLARGGRIREPEAVPA